MEWRAALSYLLPVPAARGAGRYGPLELNWQQGRLVVDSPHANQSFGALHRLWRQCFRDLRLQDQPPGSVLVLGFGTGSVAHILHKEMKFSCSITGVEGDALMFQWACEHFGFEQNGHLFVDLTDAFTFLAAHTSRHDLVVMDLFHDLDLPPGVDEPPFIEALRRCAAPHGMVCFNTIAHDEVSRQRCERVHDLLSLLFERVTERRYNGHNRVFIAR